MADLFHHRPPDRRHHLPDFGWSVYALSQYNTDKKIAEALRQRR